MEYSGFHEMILNSNRMILAEHVIGLGSAKGAVKKDEYAMKEAWEMGKQMVYLINSGVAYPPEMSRSFHATLMKDKYGLMGSPFG